MADVMTLNNNGLDTTPWWKQRWPWLLMLGPAVVVVASTYTGYLAYTQQDALVVGDYYKQGKAINQDLRRDHVAASMGLAVKLGYDAGSGTLSGHFQQQSGARPEQLMLLLSHATQPEKDIKLAVRPDANGDFHAALPMLERSRWTVLVEGAQRDWRLAGIWQWPDKRGVALNADAVQPAED